MKALWIGVGLDPESLQRLLEKKGKLLSGYVSQESIIQGLDAIGLDMDSINAMNISESVQKEILHTEWSRNGRATDVCVGYKNIKYINRLLKQRALCKAAKAWAEKNQTENDVIVFVYSMHAPFMSAAHTVKKYIPHAKICQIVLDLPQYMDMNMSKIKKILKAFDWHNIKRLMRSVDKYILYSKHMASFFGLADDSWMVMEGSFDVTSVIDEEATKPKDKLPIMYSGVLDMRYGIPELLDAFSLLEGDNFELWFTGSGNAVSLINERAENDERIHNFGFLPSRKDLLLKQKEAAMLISTRRDIEEASKYCFPSKIFEYMVSGNPVLSCRIGGIPDEYFDYLIEMRSTSPEDIRDAILKVAGMTSEERKARGEAAKRFVLDEKNNIRQAELILKFIEE